jgi:hypothetical protein
MTRRQVQPVTGTGREPTPAVRTDLGRRPFAAQMATAGIEVIIPSTRAQRRTMPKPVQRLTARFRKR